MWTQNILSLILHEGHRNGTENMEMLDRIPWVEYNIKNIDYGSLPLPRVFATHLPYYLTPKDLRNKKGHVSEVISNIQLNPTLTICLRDLVQILSFPSFSFAHLGTNITTWTKVRRSRNCLFNLLLIILQPLLLEIGMVQKCNSVGWAREKILD